MVKGCVSCGFNHETFDHVFLASRGKLLRPWSECSEKVWMHCLVATSHTLTVRSEDPETKCSLSGEKATLRTQLVWPESVAMRLPLLLQVMECKYRII